MISFSATHTIRHDNVRAELFTAGRADVEQDCGAGVPTTGGGGMNTLFLIMVVSVLLIIDN